MSTPKAPRAGATLSRHELSATARSIAGRIHTTTASRRLVPVPVALGAIEAYAAWSQRARRPGFERTRWFYGELLRHTPLAGTETDVARRAIVEQLWALELLWRPWLMRGGDVAGLEHYRSAQAQRRPIVMPFVHFGMPYGQFTAMHNRGIDAWVIAAAHHYDDSRAGFTGRVARQGRKYIDLLGPDRVIQRPDAFGRSLEVLLGGATLSIAFDLQGSQATPFLGRTVGLASGPSRLALESDAMLVPMVVRTRNHRPLLTLARPLDSRHYADEAALQAAIAVIMERWALACPECVLPLTDQPDGPPLIRDLRSADSQHRAEPSPEPPL